MSTTRDSESMRRFQKISSIISSQIGAERDILHHSLFNVVVKRKNIQTAMNDTIFQSARKTRKTSIQKRTGVTIIMFFSAIVFYSSVISPETDEKILYGKNPPGKSATNLEYSEIILSGNYVCMESASSKANGNLPNFVKEFNKCNAQ